MSEHDEHRHEQHGHGHDHRQAPGDRDWGAMADHIELDGEVLAPLLDDALARLVAAVGDGPVRRVVDAGSGPGVGTVALALAFPGAQVTALDAAEPLLPWVTARAERFGVADRVTAAVADLEHGLAVEGPVDVVWSSMVLHHVADPRRVLRDAYAALRPGGVLAVVEFGPPTSTLPADLGFGAPGFTERYDAAFRAAVADHLPPGAFDLDWPALLATAGFDLVDTALVRTDLPAPLGDAGRRWVRRGLGQASPLVRERLDADDLATLDVLADDDDPRGARQRADLEVHAARRLFLARRP